MSFGGTTQFGLGPWGATTPDAAPYTLVTVTPTTTFGLIRSNMITLIEAITPKTRSREKFVYADRERPDMRNEAEENITASFRWVEINRFDTEVLGATDFSIERRSTDAEIVIAYPHNFGNYGDRNETDLEDLIEEDTNLIMKTIGYRGADNYLDGQIATLEGDATIEQGDGVSFAAIPLQIIYYYDVS